MQTPGEFQCLEEGYGIYKSGDGVFTILEGEGGEVVFRAQSFTFDQLKRICQICRRVSGKAEARAELRHINRFRYLIGLEDLKEP